MSINLHAKFVYAEGKIYHKFSVGNVLAGSIAGYLHHGGYLIVRVDGVQTPVHNIIWKMHFGEIPEGYEVDHIDTIKTNNLISNLRLATRQQNCANRNKPVTNKSGYKGVSFHKKSQKWVAQISVEGKRNTIGYFDSPEEANDAYQEVSKLIYGEFHNGN
jgi:hypothetical protein